MEFLQRLVSRSLIHEEAVKRAQAQRDPPTHGIFGAGRAAPQQGPARQAVAVGSASPPPGGSKTAVQQAGSEWVWDAEHNRHRRWDGQKWVWSSK